MSTLLTDEQYQILARLLAYFSSSYGSNGRLKLIQTLDSSMSIYTSRSSRLQQQLKCRHLVSRLLSAAIQQQISRYRDGGLYFSILFCSFLFQLREITSNEQKKLALFRSCLDAIDQLNIPRETIHLNSVHQLLALVRAVICKSLAYSSSEHCREHLCLLTVRSFLENITVTDPTAQQLILTIEGLAVDQSALFNGLLYQISSSPHSSLCSSRSRPCLFFTISLAGDYNIEHVETIETSDRTYEWLQTVASRLTEQILSYTRLHHGGLILCQKVIHPSIKVKLRKYGIETIDRLSRQYVSYFCYLTGCQPIETLTFDALDERYFGTLTEIKQIELGKKRFLQFLNSNRPFHTLLLCSTTEQALLELKECVTASHHLLTNTLITKQAFYGAGCSESMQMMSLHSQNNPLATCYLLRTLARVIRAQYREQAVIDRVHGHLWLVSDHEQISPRCACELYLGAELFQTDWRSYVFSLENEQPPERMNDRPDLLLRQSSARYLDGYAMKSQTLKTAIETAINLHLTNVCL